MRDLSRLVRTGADAVSVARAAAPLYLDLIRRALWLFGYIDAIAFDVLEEERPFQQKMRRVTSVLRIESMVAGLMGKAFEGLLSCLGGKRRSRFKPQPTGSQVSAQGPGHHPIQPNLKLIE